MVSSPSVLPFFKKILYTYLFFYFYFWLCWVFIAVHGLSLVMASWRYSLSGCDGCLPWQRLLLQSAGSRHVDFRSWGTQVQLWGCVGLVVLRHVESSWIRDQTHVCCIGGQISIHCSTKEVPLFPFFFFNYWIHFFSLMFGSYGSHLHTFNQL